VPWALRQAIYEVYHWLPDAIAGALFAFGVKKFDELEPLQNALLADVGEHLLVRTDQHPPVTSVNEAAVAALFNCIEDQILVEIESEPELDQFKFFWRGGGRRVPRDRGIRCGSR
jgi:hypothetical protein